MTKKESGMIVGIIQKFYRQFYKNYSTDDIIDLVNTWHILLSDYNFGEFQAALKTFICADTKGFPPVPGQIIDKLQLLESAARSELNEMTAWEIVYKGICDSNYHAQEHYDNFPESIKNCIRTPATLKEWAQLGTEEVNTVIHSNFMRTFRGEQSRTKEVSKIPKDIMQMIEKKKSEQEPRIEQREYDFDKLEKEMLGG